MECYSNQHLPKASSWRLQLDQLFQSFRYVFVYFKMWRNAFIILLIKALLALKHSFPKHKHISHDFYSEHRHRSQGEISWNSIFARTNLSQGILSNILIKHLLRLIIFNYFFRLVFASVQLQTYKLQKSIYKSW